MAWNLSGKPKCGTETALDACDYFVNEVTTDLRDESAEQLTLLKHKELRLAVTSGNERNVKILLQALGNDESNVVNLTPSGANTLLFLSAQFGYEGILKLLIDSGADGRYHTVTKYSPLYAAIHNGHLKICKILLEKFPQLVQQLTVERWLPLHAACINGHTHLVELLIQHEYPSELYSAYRDDEEMLEWKLPFDSNQQDVTGQSSLYIASILGNSSLVSTLLNWKVKCYKVGLNESHETIVTPTRNRVSVGIQAIMSKLNISGENDLIVQKENVLEKCPIDLNLLCGAARETALLAAVRGGFIDVVTLLLKQGADPNIIARAVEDHNNPRYSEEIYGLCNVPLLEACKQNSNAMVEILLKYGARDEQGSAANIAFGNQNEIILKNLLAKRVYPDSDFKINKKGLPTPDETKNFIPSVSAVTYSTLFPNIPIIIDWHSSNSLQLPYVNIDWMISGVLEFNPKLKNHPKLFNIALTAITRIDFSHNVIITLPLEIFSLVSLKYLNVAQNKLEELPLPPSGEQYNCPVLEEIYLQDNRIISVPSEIFQLPSLLLLDISNNKLQNMPFAMWKSTKLRELNIAFNLLKDLPVSSTNMEMPKNILSTKDLTQTEMYTASGLGKNKYQKLCRQNLFHCNVWSQSVEIIDNDLRWNVPEQEEGVCQLSNLNIANNLFTSIPVALPCLATNLTKLNMSYNSLRSMGHVTSYPTTLRQLDLSHNEITCWPSLPRIAELDPHLQCYNPPAIQSNEEKCEDKTVEKTCYTTNSFRNNVLKNVCHHRKHLRLESLKTLILADNLLSRIQLSTDDVATFNELDGSDWSVVGITKSKLIFPNISMLDISNNCLKEIPSSLNELSSLSVLNISGNVDVTDLPPNLGLLSRLWNLNIRGCSLQDPLRAMIQSKKYKTMDIIGYLKSIYEDAQPYARMKLMVVGIQGIGKTSLLELLRQVSSQKAKNTNEHWAKRVGHKHNFAKTKKGINISTVGVDIGTWICDKKPKNNSYGPVIFRTWDFGGQKEYYATHQYFLSKRSLYLVLWRIIDGQKGLTEVLQWLRNIQARAPNSSVIIVGTHFDAVGDSFSSTKAEELQQIIRERFIAVPDAEKIGLPHVIDSIEISCRTLHNIKLLSNIIYDTAFMLRSPGSKQPLLLQKIPASYIALEDTISTILAKLRTAGMDPVLDSDSYKKLVTKEMKLNGHKSFRDSSELNQATMFLHDNGVLLHYDDSTLHNFFFLDPQWLCDMLAHVITVREINPFVKGGTMKLDDLDLLFKNTNSKPSNTKNYLISLLNKFEVALTWDARTLLIPSLLSDVEDFSTGTKFKISHKAKAFLSSSNQYSSSTTSDKNEANIFYEPILNCKPSAFRRLLIMTYFPSGFWSRLLIRLLSDDQILDAAQNIFNINNESDNINLHKYIENDIQWNLWQSGIALYIGDILLFKISQIPFLVQSVYRKSENIFKVKLDGVWIDVNVNSSSILEMFFSMEHFTIYQNKDKVGTIEIQLSVVSKLLALIVDHVDLLLEDWYPALGTRFVHTSAGKLLITRLVLCPKCFEKMIAPSLPTSPPSSSEHTFNRFLEGCKSADQEYVSKLSAFSANANLQLAKNRISEDSLQFSDADSGVGPDSAESSRNTSIDGNPLYCTSALKICYSWMIEECILSIYNGTAISCPLHLEMNLLRIAPDVVFADISKEYIIKSENIVKGPLLGRGAFGFVFKATCKINETHPFKAVAVKMLQPIPPGPRAKSSALMAYKVSVSKWNRDPLQHSCKAYCTARQEVAVLSTLKHPNVVSFLGICIKPLALVLELAPLGGLDSMLRQYRRSGARIGPNSFQTMSLQIAKAIEYLHRKRIIYRDLKSENILIWDFPVPHTEDSPKNKILMKIADYGISRMTTPSGAKGFGGTEGFMAPEIIRYNGEEEYTEKVDCFSFGMFLYECITLRQPFEGQESIKECILEGNRPSLTTRETHLPTYCLDLMIVCWNELAKKRPSASQIVSILSAPEYINLVDVVGLSHCELIQCGIFYERDRIEDDFTSLELWLPCSNNRIDILSVSKNSNFYHYRSIDCQNLVENETIKKIYPVEENKVNFSCCCIIEQSVWTGDSIGNIRVYSANNFAQIFSYILDPIIKSPVKSIIYFKNIERVSVGLENGRVFLVDSTNVPSNCTFAEGSFVLTEISCGPILHSACGVINKSCCELWCGENYGKISIFYFNASGVSNYNYIHHNNIEICLKNEDVLQLTSSKKFVFSCLNPGFIVFQWPIDTKTVANKLDCSKLLPCSESLKSISIEEHLKPTKSQISAMSVSGEHIYIGTVWGCLIVADCDTLRPITVFRPYEEEIKLITTIRSGIGDLIATIGTSYRPLLSRFMDTEYQPDYYKIQSPKQRFKNVNCLLWKPSNWA